MDWDVHNREADLRVVVTKQLPGDRWLDILAAAGCRVEVGTATALVPPEEVRAVLGDRCDGAIGQITEHWGKELFGALRAAGGRAYSNYAVGFNNIDLAAATANRIAVGNTPGVLTETTAQMAVALAFAAARRSGEAERFMRAGRYTGWLPDLLVGRLLWRKTVGVVGAGRIGAAFARMMVEGHKMDLIYYDLHPNEALEAAVAAYGRFLAQRGEAPVVCRRAATVEKLLAAADLVSLHTVLDRSTRHLIDARRLALMKPDAVLVNTSRGPVIDEAALVEHLRTHPEFRAGLDVFEDEPAMAPGLAGLDNAVVVPHIASATGYARRGMAELAAANVAGVLRNLPVWNRPDITPFLADPMPPAAPSILNAAELRLSSYVDAF